MSSIPNSPRSGTCCLRDLEGPLNIPDRPSTYPTIYKWGGQCPHPQRRVEHRKGNTYIIFFTKGDQLEGSTKIEMSTGMRKPNDDEGESLFIITATNR